MVLLASFAGNLFAQGTTSTLSGDVTDVQGGALPGAQVLVTNIATGVAKTVTTDAAGHYVASALNPGNYSLVVKAEGFSPTKVPQILLPVAVETHQDVQMSVGGMTQMVTVESGATTTETETSAVNSVIDNQQVTNIPLDQRIFYSLTQLSPAVAPPAQNSQTGYRGGFSVAGQDEIANNFIIDGYDSNDVAVGVVNYRPSVDGVQEFNLLTGVYPAEFGRVSGGQVVVSQQSGTNQFHGSVFLYLENSVANASNYFTPAAQKPAARRGQYGGTIGGPIKKDRTFFFGDFEGLAWANQIVPNAAIIPSQRQLSGIINCSPVALPAHTGINTTGTAFPATIFNDPSTGLPVPCVADPLSQTGFSSNFSLLPVWNSPQATIGRKIGSEYPVQQSIVSTDLTGNGKYQLNENRIENDSQFTVRIDHKFSDMDSLSAEYNYYNDSSFEPSNNLCGSPTIPHFGCYAFQHSQLAGVTWTHTFTPNVINEFRLDYNRLAQPRTGEDAFLPQSMFANPFPQSNNSLIPNSANGSIGATVTGYATIGNTNLPQSHTENQYQFVDSVTWIKGHHTFKAGVDIHDNISDNFFTDDGRGGVTFNTSSLSGAAGATHTSKSNLADALLGYPYQVVLNPTDPKFAGLESLIHTYFQDDWKVTPRLTLNLGLRYEFTTPVHEARNNMSTVVIKTPGAVANTPTGATVTPGVVAAVQQNSGGFGKYLYKEDKNNFAPRVGLAFQPFNRDTTVIHAGAGVFFSAPTVLNGFLSEYRQPPFRNIATYTASAASPLTLASPTGTATASATYALTGTDPNFAALYNMEYSLGFQQQLAPGLGLEVTYLGSQTRRITSLTNLNQGVATGSSPTSYRPYANNQNLTIIHSQGNAQYNSLQVKLQQQFRNGVSFLIAETFAKSMDSAPGFSNSSSSSSTLPQDSNCPKCEWGLSDFNVKNRLVLSPVVQLPFGKGKKYLNSGRLTTAIVGGWQLSSLVQVQTGRPFTVIYGTNANASFSFNNQDRPNQVANPNTGPKTVAQWFNTAAFTPATKVISTNASGGTATVGAFGTEHRNAVIGPGFVQWDATVQRNFALTEHYSFALLIQGFNVLNHPTFFNPTATSATAGLGGSLYGQLTQANTGRDLQIAGKFFF
ncbi:MAG TPA: TonB-dependent receptor [Acidobacteriaceae bacterium]|nr:TonB-dependent receptor [Acidobacteriaceae bacterium]